jgi:sterol 3beta-glucosyltransferase
MRIAILTAGSRGDVQPFVALAKGLQSAGYDVVLCTAATFESFITSHGISYAHMNDELLRLIDTDEGKAAMSGGSKFGLIKKVQPMLRAILDDTWAASQGADALIYHPKTLSGYHIAEKLNIPAFMSVPLPLYTPTSEFPNPITPQNVRLGGFYNRLTYSILRFGTLPFMGTINAWRAEMLNMPPMSRFGNEMVRSNGEPVPALYSYSPHVVPTPTDWPSHAVATGFWFLNEQNDYQPPVELQAFLDAGTPPIYIGFGSMPSVDPEEKAHIVIRALENAGQRGLIASGWGGLKASDLPANMMMIEQAPHDWLFPCVAAVVHHGGAGTTAAGLRAGKPTIICPFMGDQPFWGRRVQELGVGTAPIPQKQLTVEALSKSIRTAVSDVEMQCRAAELGEKIRTEDGVGQAVKIIQTRLGITSPQLA